MERSIANDQGNGIPPGSEDSVRKGQQRFGDWYRQGTGLLDYKACDYRPVSFGYGVHRAGGYAGL